MPDVPANTGTKPKIKILSCKNKRSLILIIFIASGILFSRRAARQFLF